MIGNYIVEPEICHSNMNILGDILIDNKMMQEEMSGKEYIKFLKGNQDRNTKVRRWERLKTSLTWGERLNQPF